jgi:hypothetical protein
MSDVERLRAKLAERRDYADRLERFGEWGLAKAERAASVALRLAIEEEEKKERAPR